MASQGIPQPVQELVLLDLLGIKEAPAVETRLWEGISERVYFDGDLDALEAYSEYHLLADRWSQSKGHR